MRSDGLPLASPFPKGTTAVTWTATEKLKAWAGEVNLDVAAFGSCLASGKHSAGVRKDVAEGARLGVEGTPAFFINGRLLSGAQPLENFVRVIEEELAQPQH